MSWLRTVPALIEHDSLTSVMLFSFLDRGRIEAEKLDDVLPMDKQLALV